MWKFLEKEQSYPYKKSSSPNPLEIAIESKDLDRVSFTELYPTPRFEFPSESTSSSTGHSSPRPWFRLAWLKHESDIIAHRAISPL